MYQTKPPNQYKIKLVLLFSLYLSLPLFFYFHYTNKIEEVLQPVELTLKNFPRTFELKNLLEDDEILKKKNVGKIFFIETHVESDRKLDNPRQACSVESAARINPDLEIYFTFATNTTGVALEYSELVQVLSDYPNINFRFLNPEEISRGHFLEDFFQKDMLANSTFHVANRANALRALLLSKYGGQYLDLDVISLVPLSKINLVNYGCIQEKDVVNNAVLNFDGEKGNEILREYGKHLLSEFKPNTWGANGPKLFSKVLKTFCNGTTLDEKKYTKCSEFTAIPKSKCYEITFPEYQKFYEEIYRNETMKRIKDSQSYFVHIWNKMQDFGHNNYKLRADSKSAYVELAKENCPRVFKTIEKYF